MKNKQAIIGAMHDMEIGKDYILENQLCPMNPYSENDAIPFNTFQQLNIINKTTKDEK